MLPLFDKFRMKQLLPLKLEDPDEGCIRPSEDVYCFQSGDPRVNEQGGNSIDIFLGPVSGPKPCPNHFCSFETSLI